MGARSFPLTGLLYRNVVKTSARWGVSAGNGGLGNRNRLPVRPERSRRIAWGGGSRLPRTAHGARSCS